MNIVFIEIEPRVTEKGRTDRLQIKCRELGASLLGPLAFSMIRYVPALTEVKLEATWQQCNGRFSLLLIACLFDPFSLPKAPDSLKILKCPRPEITYLTMREMLVYKRKDVGFIYIYVLYKYNIYIFYI